jgi:hypothetical protein
VCSSNGVRGSWGNMKILGVVADMVSLVGLVRTGDGCFGLAWPGLTVGVSDNGCRHGTLVNGCPLPNESVMLQVLLPSCLLLSACRFVDASALVDGDECNDSLSTVLLPLLRRVVGVADVDCSLVDPLLLLLMRCRLLLSAC